MKSKVFIFGIDGFVPKLVFEKYKKHLPTFAGLMKKGIYARLTSTVPPSSIVAWTSLNSGYDPSQTGIHSYTQKPARGRKTVLTNSKDIRVPLLWDRLTKEKKRTIALNIPLTYPVKPINGVMISDFLTPSFDNQSVYPLPFKRTVKKLIGGKDYMFDVAAFTGYKKMGLDILVKQSYEMTKQHFAVAKHLFQKEDWDLFDMVVIGTDRLHHMFWRHIDPTHPLYVKNSKYKNVILDFYKYIDEELSWFLKSPKVDDRTSIIVASDHGMDKMIGRVNLNDWLRENNYLHLTPEGEILYGAGPKKLDYNLVDWKKTTAIASGGYQGRIYVHAKTGKERIIKTLARELKAIRGARGEKLDNRIFEATRIYKKKDSEAPDLTVYFDNLIYGVNNDVGNVGLYSNATSVGVDDAGHATLGSFIFTSPELKKRGDQGTLDILRVAPTVLKLLGSKTYKQLPGKPLI